MKALRSWLAAAVFATTLTLAGGLAFAGHHEEKEANPCATNPCNPCASSGAATNPCNPCAQNPCQPTNPCNPCSPQADEEQ